MTKKQCKEKLKSNRESEKALATLQSEKDCLSALLTNFIFDSLYQCAAQGINLIANQNGENSFEKWITAKRAEIDFSSDQRRVMLAVFFLMSPAMMTDEKVKEILDRTPLK